MSVVFNFGVGLTFDGLVSLLGFLVSFLGSAVAGGGTCDGFGCGTVSEVGFFIVWVFCSMFE